MWILEFIGNAIVVIGIVFMAIGIVGIFRFRRFYEKVLVASTIDTAGTIAIIFGIILIHGIDFFSARLLLLLGIVLLLGPLSTHIVARSAYMSEGGKE